MSGSLGGLLLVGLAVVLAVAWFRGALNAPIAWVTGAFTAPPTPSSASTGRTSGGGTW